MELSRFLPRSTDGTDSRSACVYGCFGEESNSAVGPVSTILPAYMTATRSHILAMMLKS